MRVKILSRFLGLISILFASSTIALVSCSQQQSTTESSAPPVATQPSASPAASAPKSLSRPDASPLQLILDPQVKAALKLTEAQASRIEKIDQDLRGEVQKLMEGTDIAQLAKDKAKQDALRSKGLKAYADVNQVLEPTQLQRLKGITLQIYGFGVLSYDQFVKDLNLTTDQQAKLADLREKTFEQIQLNVESAMKESTATSQSEAQAKVKELFTVSNQEAVAVLTADQKSKLKSLEGEKFALDPSKTHLVKGER